MVAEGKELQSGSGTTVQDINKFITSYEMTKKMMKKVQNNKGGMKNALKGIDMNSLKNMKI
jgi:signal recognition particle GTPase